MKKPPIFPLDEIERLAESRARARTQLADAERELDAAKKRVERIEGHVEGAREALEAAESGIRLHAARLVGGEA